MVSESAMCLYRCASRVVSFDASRVVSYDVVYFDEPSEHVAMYVGHVYVVFE